MSLFGPTRIACPAGVWTRILTTRAGGMPAYWSVRFEGPVAGSYRVRRSFLPLGIAMKVSEEGALGPQLEIERGWFDASHDVEVCPDQPVVAVVD